MTAAKLERPIVEMLVQADAADFQAVVELVAAKIFFESLII